VDKLIPEFYAEYGQYVNHFRQFPLSNDGLRPVERRVLLSCYMIAKDHLVKCAKVEGFTLGNFHPHSSVYGTIVQMYHMGFLEKQGNMGTYWGIEPKPPAAMRYTECKLSKRTLDMAFKLIDYVPWNESELDKEPDYLPTMFPFCLLGTRYTTGIGFGYKTYIPCYTIEDLNKRLLFLIGKNKEKPLIKPISECKILASDEELESLLSTGKASIKVQGIYKVDKIRCKVSVNSWPPDNRFETILSKFEKELNNQDIGYNNLSAAGKTEIVFEVIKQRNRDEIFNNFVNKLDKVLSGNVPFEMIVVDKNKINPYIMSVDEMLLNTYNMYKNTNIIMLNSEIERYKKNIDENILLSKIKPILSIYLKTDTPVDEIAKKISEELKVDDKIIKELFQKYNIRKLLTVKDDVTELNNKLNQTYDYLKNIDEFVLSAYHNIV
jgi:DNA gyrase subunit A